MLTVTCQTLIGQVNPQLVSKINQNTAVSVGLNGIDGNLVDIIPLSEK